MKSHKVITVPPIYSHTGLRGIAAMYVTILHLGGSNADLQESNSFFQLFYLGGYSVDLFFILSGFILNWVYLWNATQVNWTSYLRARVARILPLYYLTLLLFVSVTFFSFSKYGSTYISKDFPIDLALNICLLSGFTAGPEHTINYPAWSISTEFFCYLAVFPLLVLLKNWITSKPYAQPALILIVGISILGFVTFYSLPPISIWHWQWHSSFLTRGIWGFSTGFFLCSIFRERADWKPSASTVDFVISICIAIFFLAGFKYVPKQLMLFTLPFIVFFSAADCGFAASVLTTKPFQWLGERSYSIYLWHVPCLEFTTRFLKLNTHMTIGAYMVLLIAIILVVSEISYRFFECPIREYIRGHSRTESSIAKL